jgi:transcriptional regulator with XRE-family HTH domain
LKYIINFSLKKIRKDKNLTQTQLAHLSGISQSYISEIESFLKSPTLDTITILANALQIHPHKLQEIIISENE